jgi:hypothetical protein
VINALSGARIALIALGFCACRPSVVPVTASFVSMGPDGIVLDVQSEPDMTVLEGVEVFGRTDGEGKARVTIPLSEFEGMMSANFVSLRVGRSSMGFRKTGSVTVRLPMEIGKAAKLPREEGAWLRLVDGPTNDVGDAWLTVNGTFGSASVRYAKSDGRVRVRLMAPRGARVVVDGVPVSLDEAGLGEVPVSFDRLLTVLSTWTMPPLSLQATVTAAGKTTEGVIVLAPIAPPPEETRHRLEAIRAGQPLRSPPHEGRVMAAYLPGDQGVHFKGGAPLSEIDVVVYGTSKPEVPMPDCTDYVQVGQDGKKHPMGPVKRWGSDEEVVAVDARTGKELKRSTFPAMPGCPTGIKANERVVSRPWPDDVLAWALAP